MDKKLEDKAQQMSQPQHWSDAELRRVSRVLELLIRVDKRLKERKK